MCSHGRSHTPPMKTHTATHTMGLRLPSCLLLLPLVLLVPAALVAALCTNTDPCIGQPDCDSCDPGALVPDPENCRGFYVCPDTSLSYNCGNGQVFDAVSGKCETGDECDSCPVVPPTGSCSYECLADGFMSSSTDCHIYYECTGTTPTGPWSCGASTPFFDGEKCQTDEKLCCHCHPYCYAVDVAGTVVADPLDCRGYYLCTKPSEVPTVFGTCSDGENFDILLGTCSASASCDMDVSCLNVVRPDGCIDPFTCVSVGYFARCPNQCTPDYYHCTAATGTFQGVESCGGGTVFHPDNHNCVSPANCPY